MINSPDSTPFSCKLEQPRPFSLAEEASMPQWPATRVTLLDRLRDRQDQEAWAEFVGLYGPPVFRFARRRLPQDDDAADIVQEVLGAVLGGSYQRTTARFQKWLVTVLLNKIRDFHVRRARRGELSGGTAVAELLEAEPDRDDLDDWEQEHQRQLFRVAAERVRSRCNPQHWEAFARTALGHEAGLEVAHALQLSLANVYAVKCRLLKEIKDEIQRIDED
jgi:RNA polymerase sigma-70 factor (ECF subfamily)